MKNVALLFVTLAAIVWLLGGIIWVAPQLTAAREVIPMRYEIVIPATQPTPIIQQLDPNSGGGVPPIPTYIPPTIPPLVAAPTPAGDCALPQPPLFCMSAKNR